MAKYQLIGNTSRPCAHQHVCASCGMTFATRWDRQVASNGSASSSGMGSEPEKTLIQFCDPIANCLAWYEKTWLPLEKELKELGFLWDKFMIEQPVVVGPTGEITRLANPVGGPLPIMLVARL